MALIAGIDLKIDLSLVLEVAGFKSSVLHVVEIIVSIRRQICAGISRMSCHLQIDLQADSYVKICSEKIKFWMLPLRCARDFIPASFGLPGIDWRWSKSQQQL